MPTPHEVMWPNCDLTSSHHHFETEAHPGSIASCGAPGCIQIVNDQLNEAREQDADDARGRHEDMARELDQITAWWLKVAKDDSARTVPKAVEYGAADFDLMGQFMVALIGDKLNGATDDEKMRMGREMAIAFYLVGKLGRAVGAYARGIHPSDDTLFDTRIYAMMWQRVRETGTWVQG